MKSLSALLLVPLFVCSLLVADEGGDSLEASRRSWPAAAKNSMFSSCLVHTAPKYGFGDPYYRQVQRKVPAPGILGWRSVTESLPVGSELANSYCHCLVTYVTSAIAFHPQLGPLADSRDMTVTRGIAELGCWQKVDPRFRE